MPSPHQRPRLGLAPGSSGQYRADSISTSAELLQGGATALANRTRLLVQPMDGAIYVGRDASVTTSTGLMIASGAVWELTGAWYGIAASAVDVRIHELVD
jgi:hypothetical protein